MRFLRHDSTVSSVHQEEGPGNFRRPGPLGVLEPVWPGYPSSGCSPAEPDSVSPGKEFYGQATERTTKRADQGTVPGPARFERPEVPLPGGVPRGSASMGANGCISPSPFGESRLSRTPGRPEVPLWLAAWPVAKLIEAAWCRARGGRTDSLGVKPDGLERLPQAAGVSHEGMCWGAAARKRTARRPRK